MRFLPLCLALALAACAESGGDPCVAVDQAAERHLAAARSHGVDDADLEQHRAALRVALREELSPRCPHDPPAVALPEPPALSPPVLE